MSLPRGMRRHRFRKKERSLLMLALCSSFSSWSSELTIQPTLKLHAHAIERQQEDATTEMKDMIHGADGLLKAEYSTKWIDIIADLSTTNYNHERMREYDLSYSEQRLRLGSSDSWSMLSFYVEKSKDRELLSSLQSIDDNLFFSQGTTTDVIHDSAGIELQSPEHWPVSVLSSAENRTYETIDDVTTKRLNYRNSSIKNKISSQNGPRDWRWSASTENDESTQYNGPQFKNERLIADTAYPLWNRIGLMLVSKYNFDEYSQEHYDPVSTETYRQRAIGLGFAMSSDDQSSFFQVTSERELDRKTNYIAGQFRHTPSKDIKITGSIDRRFYGDDTQFLIDYRRNNWSFNFSKSNRTELRHVTTANRLLSELYACPTTLEDLDKELCRLLNNLNEPIENTEKIFPVFSFTYPIEQRFTLVSASTIDINWDAKRWSHSLNIDDSSLEEIDFGRHEKTRNVHYIATRGKGRRHELDISFGRKSINVDDKTNTVEVMAGVSFTRNLNTRASFKVAYEYRKRTSNDPALAYEENRIGLVYTHRFFKKNGDI